MKGIIPLSIIRSAVGILWALLILTPDNAYSQSRMHNYIVTRTYINPSGTAYQNKIDYYDGLGRFVQSVLQNASPNGGDIVSLQEYDNLGRESYKWNPVGIASNSGMYVPPAIIKSNAISMYGDSYPYSMLLYESSPLNRLQEQYGPGEDWYSHAHSVKTSYLTNISGNDTLSCICYAVNSPANDTILTLTRVKEYASGELFVTRTQDEEGSVSFEFRNKTDQVLLTRQFLPNRTGKTLVDTYYIYDDFNNLAAVLPPQAAEAFRTSASATWRSDTESILSRYAFLYKYNSRNLPIAKKLPGCSWSFYIYDKGERLVFSQDGNMRLRGEWLFSIPDVFGKECFTGICLNALDVFSNPLGNVLIKATWQTDASDTAGSGPYKGYFLTGVSLVSPTILQVNYYNDYSFLGKNGIPAQTDARSSYDDEAEAEGFGKRYKASAQGMLTGVLTAQLDNSGVSGYLYSVMYYDSKDRIIQTKSSNHMSGGSEKEYIAYNFTGQPIKKKHIHSATGKPTQTEIYTYTYDQAGRILTTIHQLNGSTPVTLVSNSYDAVGRLTDNGRNGQPALKTSYTYNVRSWIKNITGSLFHQNLYYNDKRSNLTNFPRYNGNISAMDWGVASDRERGYDFSYDALSRLTAASYLEENIRSNKFSTSYSYDTQGNMSTLRRRGNVGTSTYGTIDSLTLAYRGNQLASVEDKGTNPTLSMSLDFKDESHQDGEYSYDENGNLTKDLNKGISNIEYNILNLPRRVTFCGTSNPVNEYVYSASDRKLSVIHKSPIEKRTDYVGNMIYENGSLKRILVDGGYIESGEYYFYLQDHLGNNRVVAKSDGTVVQTNHYYPYGMTFAESTFTDKQPYKYNGKELDTGNGLNLYDYEARQMDGALGRFTGVDAMAEKYYSISPYMYVGNNPVNRIDPNGRDWIQDRFGSYLWDDNAIDQLSTRNGWSYIGKNLPNDIDVSTDYKILIEIDGHLYHKNFNNILIEAANSVLKTNFITNKNYDPESDHMMHQFVETGAEFTLAGIGGKFINKGVNKLFNSYTLDIGTKFPVGRSGNVMENFFKGPYNKSAIIDGVKFTGHAFDQMANRGIISPTAVIDVVKSPTQILKGNLPNTTIYIKDNLKVVTNNVGDIVTVMWQR